MKPISLKIAGLHSFREAQEISFTDLSDTGVFGIFGPTGSGKSTILDAMTLALYGTVGRAEHNTRGILNHAETSLSVAFEFAIGSSPRLRYRVERHYRRKDDIAVQNVRSRIVECSDVGDIVLADKDSEVTAVVKDVLGLEPDDFTRAVVLPQGKFAEFLNLKGADRNRMLQRLFSLERFGDGLQHRLKQQYDEAEQQRAVLAAQQLGMGDASAGALAAAEGMMEQAEHEAADAKATLSAVRTEQEAARTVWDVQQKLEQVQAEQAALQERAEQIRRAEQKLSAAERADAVAPFIDALTEADTALADAQARSRQLREEAERQTEAHARANLRWTEATAALEASEPDLLVKHRQLEEALEWEQELLAFDAELADLARELTQQVQAEHDIAERLQRIELGVSAMAQQRASLQEQTEQRTISAQERQGWHRVYETRQAVQQASQLAEVARAQRTADQQSLAQAEENYQRLLAERKEAGDLLARLQAEVAEHAEAAPDADCLRQMASVVERLQYLARQLAAREAQQAEAQRVLSTRTNEREGVRRAWEAAVKVHEQAKRELLQLEQERSQLWERQAAVRLASHLHDGDACPVCGAMTHPALAADNGELARQLEMLDERLQSLRLEVEQRGQEVTRQERRQIELDAAAASAAESLAAVEQTLLQLQSDIRDVHSEAPVQAEPLQEWLTGFIQHHRDLEQACATWVEADQQLHARLAEVEARVSPLHVEVAKLETRVAGLAGDVERQEMRVRDAERALSEAVDALKSALAGVGVTDVMVDHALLTRLDQRMQTIADDDAYVEQAKAELQSLDEQLRAQSGERDKLQQHAADLRVQRVQLEVQQRDREKRATELRDAVRERTQGSPAATALQEVKDALTALRNAVAAATSERQALAEQRAAAESAAAAAEATAEAARRQRERAAAVMSEKLAQAHFVTREEAADARLDAAEQAALAEQVRTWKERARVLNALQEQLLADLGDSRLTEEQWLELQERVQAVERRWQDAITAVGVAREALEKLRERHAQWLELEQARIRWERRVEQLSTLRQLLSGNKFVEFVAEEQLEFVARQASDRLKQLTRGRYALEVAADGRFVMRDDYNGGVRRPVSTLSGGETFLTSLSLALSLSAQIQLQGKYPLEFFFLDEGFGTLDPELLEVVMSTLDKLHMENMTIGVISHVPELRQRLQRRLIVEPAEASGRGSRVRLELA